MDEVKKLAIQTLVPANGQKKVQGEILAGHKILEMMPNVHVVFCGDFNCESDEDISNLLVRGAVTVERQGKDGQPILKEKVNKVGVFTDAANEFFRGDAPATLVLPNLMPKMLAGNRPAPPLVAAVHEMFQAYCSPGRETMSKSDVERYLRRVNLRFDGEEPEMKKLAENLESTGQEELHEQDLLDIYTGCALAGKFWAAEAELNLAGGFGVEIPSDGPCSLRMDFMYYTPSTMKLLMVRDPLTVEQRARMYGPPWDVLPNEWHPSDHLPVAAEFGLK